MKAWLDVHYITIVVLIFVLGFALRLINLEQDLPPYNQTGLSQTDECYYAFWAVHNFLEQQNRVFPFSEVSEYYKTVVQSESYPITMPFLKIFGNNYYGLRIGIVLTSILSILFIFLTIIELVKNRILSIFMLILLFFDYYFFAISRVQNPQIYSILGLSLFLLLATKGIRQYRYIPLATVVLILSIVIFYPYNIFALFGYGIFILVEDIKARKIDQTKYLALGGLLSIVLFALILFLLDSSFQEYISYFTKFAEVRDERTSNPLQFKNIFMTSLQFVYTNLFRYNFAYFCLVLLFLYDTLLLKLNSKIHALLVFVFVGIFIQSVFANSYPFKKLVTLFPFVIIILAVVLNDLKTAVLKQRNLRIALAFLFLGLFWLNQKTTHDLNFWSGFAYGYSFQPIPLSYLITQWLLFLSFITFFVFWYSSKLYSYLVLVTMIFTGGIFVLKNQFLEATFFHKEFLVEFAEKYPTEKVVLTAGFSHAFSFYNKSKPIISPYYFNDQAQKTDYISRLDSTTYTFMFIDKTKGGELTPKLDTTINHRIYQLEYRKHNDVYGFNVYKLSQF